MVVVHDVGDVGGIDDYGGFRREFLHTERERELLVCARGVGGERVLWRWLGRRSGRGSRGLVGGGFRRQLRLAFDGGIGWRR